MTQELPLGHGRHSILLEKCCVERADCIFPYTAECLIVRTHGCECQGPPHIYTMVGVISQCGCTRQPLECRMYFCGHSILGAVFDEDNVKLSGSIPSDM